MSAYFLLSTFLFCVGLAIVITRKNAIFVLIGIELMLNAANVNFVALSTIYNLQGQFFALFVIVVAAAEAAVALAIVLKVYRYYYTVELDQLNELKGE